MLIPFEYLFKKYRIKTNGVLHLGANQGQEASDYAALGVPKVIWVEALPRVYQQLLVHLRHFTNQTALCACVSDKDGEEVTFNIANNSAQSSSMLEWGTHPAQHPSVKWIGHERLLTKRVDTLLKENNITLNAPWFLNADLQGAELLAMKGMGDALREFQYVYVEVNEEHLYKGCPLVADIDTFLERAGFVPKEKKMTGNGWGDKFYMRP